MQRCQTSDSPQDEGSVTWERPEAASARGHQCCSALGHLGAPAPSPSFPPTSVARWGRARLRSSSCSCTSVTHSKTVHVIQRLGREHLCAVAGQSAQPVSAACWWTHCSTVWAVAVDHAGEAGAHPGLSGHSALHEEGAEGRVPLLRRLHVLGVSGGAHAAVVAATAEGLYPGMHGVQCAAQARQATVSTSFVTCGHHGSTQQDASGLLGEVQRRLRVQRGSAWQSWTCQRYRVAALRIC